MNIKKIFYKHNTQTIDYESAIRILEEARTAQVGSAKVKMNLGGWDDIEENCTIDHIIETLKVHGFEPRVVPEREFYKPYIVSLDGKHTVYQRKGRKDHELRLTTRVWYGNGESRGNKGHWMNANYSIADKV